MRIGLEIHVQLPTRSKMFCPCSTASSDEPNVNVCPTCLGMPGSRPSLNRAALELGLTIAKLLGCEVPETTWFSRKTYFYPDLAKHFQITQYETPIGGRGEYEFRGKTIRITRVHLEEDPGKTRRVGDSSLIDYNRSGIPLVEIVTEPDLSSPSEARAFLSELITSIRHAVDLPEDGDRSIRVDCNLSVGTERCEVKNVTGLRNVENALKYEAIRQTKVLRAGGKVIRETRRYDEERKITLPARKKEFEEDYGYIGEPDLGIYHIRRMAESLEIGETPAEMVSRLMSKYGLREDVARQIVNTSATLGEWFESISNAIGTEDAVKWVTGPISASWGLLKKTVNANREIISVLRSLKEGGITDVEAAMQIKGIATGKDVMASVVPSADLDSLVNVFLDKNPDVVDDFRKNPKALNRVIGSIMRSTSGKYSSQEIVEAAERLMRER